MSVRISDIIKLRSLKKFNRITGDIGLDNEVSTVSLADLEVDNNLVAYSNSFRRGSFVIASMRLESKLKDTDLKNIINALVERKASGLAYNSKMLKKPSKQIQNLCAEKNFPLLAFDPEEVYIENVVFDIMRSIQESSVSFSMEREVERMLHNSLSRDDVRKMAMSISPDFHRNCTVTYIKSKDPNSEFSPGRVARNYTTRKDLSDVVVSLLAYRDGLIVIISMPRIDFKIRDKVLDDIMGPQNKRKGIFSASSSEHLTYEEMDRAFRECNYAYIYGIVENRERTEYDNIGLYKLLIPYRSEGEFANFMTKYIKGMTKEQLDTAIAFIRCNGDFDETAKELICHKNTVRYRINKIHENLDPDLSDFKFYENLSAAIKIYLISDI